MTDSPHLLDPRLIEAARAADIVALAKRAGARLKDVRAAEWKWAGPCPGCGGTDRFALNKELGIFNCRRFGGGDTIAMVRHALGLDFVEAVEFIVGSSCAAEARADPAPAAKPTRSDDKTLRIERARKIWGESVEPRGTIVERYLAGRELDLGDDIANRVIRFHPSLAWRESDDDPVILVPAMIAVMRTIFGDEIVAVSCRRLTPDGEKVGKPKFRGAAADAAIKLDADDEVLGGLYIGEGVETCMSGRRFGLRPSWALASKGQLAKFPVLSGIEVLTILAEPDAEAEVRDCGQRWHSAGREVLLNRAIGGKDLNDALRGAA